jgi:hypothetical protein
MSRDTRLSIKISEEKRDELRAMAESYGVTMSALSALIIGQWLYQQNEIVKPMVESMKEVISESVKEAIENGKQENV